MQNRVETAKISREVTPTKFVSAESKLTQSGKPINVVLETSKAPQLKDIKPVDPQIQSSNSPVIHNQKQDGIRTKWDQVKIKNLDPLTNKKNSQHVMTSQSPGLKLELQQVDQRLSSAGFINKRYQIYKKSKSTHEFLQNIGILENEKPKSTRAIEQNLYERLSKTNKRLHSAYQYVNVPIFTEFKINQTKGWNKHIRKDLLANSGTLTVSGVKNEKRLDLNNINGKKRLSSAHSKKKLHVSKSKAIPTKQQLIQEEINRINNEIELQKQAEAKAKQQRIYIPSHVTMDAGLNSNNSPQVMAKRYNDAFHNKAQKAFTRNQEAKVTMKYMKKNIVPVTQDLKLNQQLTLGTQLKSDFEKDPKSSPNTQPIKKIMVDLSFLEARQKQKTSLKVNSQQNMMLKSKHMAEQKVKSKFLKKQMTQEEALVAKGQEEMLKINKIQDFLKEKPPPLKLDEQRPKPELGQDLNFILETSKSAGTQVDYDDMINTERIPTQLQASGSDKIEDKHTKTDQQKLKNTNKLIQIVNNDSGEQATNTELHSTNRASGADQNSPSLIRTELLAQIEKSNVSDKKFINKIRKSKTNETLVSQLDTLQDVRNKNIHLSKMYQLKLKQQLKQQRQNNPQNISETIEREKAGIISRRVSHTPDIVNQLVTNAELRNLITRTQKFAGQKGADKHQEPQQASIFDNTEIMMNLQNEGRSQSVQNKKLFTNDIDGFNQKRGQGEVDKMRTTSFSRLANHSKNSAQYLQKRCRTANILRTEFDDIRIFQEQTPFFEAFGFSNNTRQQNLQSQKVNLKIQPINPNKIEQIFQNNVQQSARIMSKLDIQNAYKRSHINLQEYCIIQKRFRYQPEKCLKTIFSKNQSQQSLANPGCLDYKRQSGLNYVMRNLKKRISKNIMPNFEVQGLRKEDEALKKSSRPVSRESQIQRAQRLNNFVAQMEQIPYEESRSESEGENIDSVIGNIQKDFQQEINEQVLKNSRSKSASETASAIALSHIQTDKNKYIQDSQGKPPMVSNEDIAQEQINTIVIGEGALFQGKPGIRAKKALKSSVKQKSKEHPIQSSKIGDIISLDKMQRSVSYRGLRGVIRPKTQIIDSKQFIHQNRQQRQSRKMPNKKDQTKDNKFDSNYMALSQTLFADQSQSQPNMFSQYSAYHDNQSQFIQHGQNKILQTQEQTASRNFSQSKEGSSQYTDLLLNQPQKQRISVKSFLEEKNSSSHKKDDPAQISSSLKKVKNADYSTESVQENGEEYHRTPTLEHFQMPESDSNNQVVAKGAPMKQVSAQHVNQASNGGQNEITNGPAKLHEIIQSEIKVIK